LVLGEPNIYQDLVCFTRIWEDCGDYLTCEELSGGYLQVVMGGVGRYSFISNLNPQTTCS
jgi:hypothetical protein